ncbi:hypothetical protein WA026_018058 [Henosepilachna vigintioctopunctata]|uniref:Uncharacterized protein n=1 Tax=Henosepilachna vigintioctopunctata TaxID=420089 RepID=A0AAW1UH83_9CUCU
MKSHSAGISKREIFLVCGFPRTYPGGVKSRALCLVKAKKMINDPSVPDRYTPFQLVRCFGLVAVSDKLLIVTFKLISIVLRCRAETENHLLNRETNAWAFALGEHGIDGKSRWLFQGFDYCAIN